MPQYVWYVTDMQTWREGGHGSKKGVEGWMNAQVNGWVCKYRDDVQMGQFAGAYVVEEVGEVGWVNGFHWGAMGVWLRGGGLASSTGAVRVGRHGWCCRGG